MLPVVYSPIAERYFKKLNDKVLSRKFKEAINDCTAKSRILVFRRL